MAEVRLGKVQSFILNIALIKLSQNVTLWCDTLLDITSTRPTTISMSQLLVFAGRYLYYPPFTYRNGVCPIFGTHNTTSYPDKFADREIRDLTVTCENNKNGCRWSDRLGNYEVRKTFLHWSLPSHFSTFSFNPLQLDVAWCFHGA